MRTVVVTVTLRETTVGGHLPRTIDSGLGSEVLPLLTVLVLMLIILQTKLAVSAFFN